MNRFLFIRSTISFVALIILVILLMWGVGPNVDAAFAQDQGNWSTGAPAPTKRTEVAAAAVGGMIYVVGGFHEPGLGSLLDYAISRAVEVYDPTKNSWSTTTPLPEGRHHAGIAAFGGHLYVIGGFTKSLMSVWNAVGTVYRYDPATEEWTELTPMPTARGGLGVAVYNGRLYAIGGYDGEQNPPVVEVFDPQTNSWKFAASLPTPRDHLAVVTAGSRIYAIGGRPKLNYRKNMDVVEEYDPSTDQWRPRASLPTARSGITAGVIDGMIYVLGGESGEGTFATNEAFFPQDNRWKTMAPMPTARHGLGSAVMGGRLYVISGGPTPGGSFSDRNEIFFPPSLTNLSSTQRASPSEVGSVMALLAMFQDADALPPENSSEANQLIHALIQLQAVVMKSSNPAVHQYVSSALDAKLGARAGGVHDQIRRVGLSSEALEALVDFGVTHPMRDQSAVLEGFQAFNVRRADWALLQQTVQQARLHLKAKQETLHDVYARRRQEMPGARP